MKNFAPKKVDMQISANFSKNVFQTIMPDEEAGRDRGILDELEIKSEGSCRLQAAGCRSACANMLKVKMSSRYVEPD